MSIVNIDGGVIDVIVTDGDTHLGGQDIDRRFIDFCIDDIKK